jgi:DNA-binding PadR family transcriptional regulator
MILIGMPARRQAEPDAGHFLPLKPVWFHILLTLSEQPTHGYAIRQAVAKRTDGQLTLWPATLYGSISELEDGGLIDEWEPSGRQDDVSRRFYRVTPLGTRVLVRETERLETLVRLARAATGRRRLT